MRRIGQSKTAGQAELAWSAEGGVLAFALAKKSGGEALARDPLLAILRQMLRASLVWSLFLSSEDSHLGPVMGCSMLPSPSGSHTQGKGLH